MRRWVPLLLWFVCITLPAAMMPCRLKGDHAEVPVRLVVEVLGGAVDYRPDWGMATATLDKQRVYFTALPVPVYPPGHGLCNGVLYDSARRLADELYVAITFDAPMHHITLQYSGRKITLPVVTKPAPRPHAHGTYPLIDARRELENRQGVLLGGAMRGKWVTDDDIAPRLGTSRYRRYRLDGEIGVVTGGQPTPFDENGTGVRLNRPAPAVGDTLGLRAPWNAMPRRPVLLNPHGAVPRTIARAVLRANGLPRATVHVTQALQIDLYGDGRYTTLVTAASPRTPEHPWGDPGTYSFTAARTPTHHGLRLVVLEGLFCTRTVSDGYYLASRIAGVLDLDGDGVPEIVTGQIEYEGEGFAAYRLNDGHVERLFGSYYGL